MPADQAARRMDPETPPGPASPKGRAEAGADDSSAGRREKSPNAFWTIGEVADDLGVPQHVLRFWETKFSQVKPLKRGGGRRYYRPEDVALLRRIRVLLHDDGLTIRGVQKLLSERGVKALLAHPEEAVLAPPADPPAGAAEPPSPAPDAETPITGRQMLAQVVAELEDIKRFLRAAAST